MTRLATILASIALLALLPADSAFAWVHGSSSSPSVQCPYGTGATDFCSAAPNGSVQHSTMFTAYGLQSSQSYVAATCTASISAGIANLSACSGGTIKVPYTVVMAGVPAGVYISSLGTGSGGDGTYNLANAGSLSASGTAQLLRRDNVDLPAVEYAVGSISGTVWKDPTTDPSMSGCSLHSTAHNYYVRCDGVTNPDWEGFDFAHTTLGGADPTGQSCVAFYSANSVGAVTFRNNNLGNYAGTGSNWTCESNSALVRIDDGSSQITAVDIESNTLDANGLNSPDQNAMAATVRATIDTSAKTITNKYNAYLNTIAKAWQFNVSNQISEANYYEGIGPPTMTQHGELNQSSPYVGGSLTSQLTLKYELFMGPSTFSMTNASNTSLGGITALWWISSGNGANTIGQVTMDHNTMITNFYTGTITGSSPASLLVNPSYDTITNSSYTNLWYDISWNSGARCYSVTAGATQTNPPTYSATSLLTGNVSSGTGNWSLGCYP